MGSDHVAVDDHGGVTIDAGDQANDHLDDVFHVVRDGNETSILLNNVEVYSGDADAITRLTIVGSGDNDRLILDYSASDPIPNGDVHFDAGAQSTSSGDSLEFRSGIADSITHSIETSGSGSARIDGTAVSYTGVESVVDTLAAGTRELTLPASGGAFTLANAPEAGLSVIESSTTADVTFANPSERLTLDLSAHSTSPGDTLHVLGLDSEFDADLAIHGDGGDAVDFAGDVNLGHGHLRVAAETIDIDGSITSDGGSFHIDADGSLTVADGASLTSPGGLIDLDAGSHGTLLVYGDVDVSNTADGGHGGTIHLLGDHVGLGGGAHVDASGDLGGGTVHIGGDFQGDNPDLFSATHTSVGQDVTITADAITDGNGGKVIVWSDESTLDYGSISARGGLHSGDGGFVEVSGAIGLEMGGRVDLRAPYGSTGTLLLDPLNIRIDGGTGDGSDDTDASATDLINDAGSNTAGSILFADEGSGSPDPFIITEQEIEAQSAAASIVLEARNSITVSGTFNNDADGGGTDDPGTNVVLIQGGNSLTMTTRNDAGEGIGGIDLTDGGTLNGLEFKTTGTGTITMTSGSGGAEVGNAPITIGKLSAASGNISITAEGDLTVVSGTIETTGSTADVTLTSVNGAIKSDQPENDGNKEINTAGGKITLDANTGITDSTGTGAFEIDSGGGDVDIVRSGSGLVSVRYVSSDADTLTLDFADNGTGHFKYDSDSTGDLTVNSMTLLDGNLEVSNAGNISVAGKLDTSAGTNDDLSLAATGGSSEIKLENVNDILTAGGGKVTLQAGNRINVVDNSADVEVQTTGILEITTERVGANHLTIEDVTDLRISDTGGSSGQVIFVDEVGASTITDTTITVADASSGRIDIDYFGPNVVDINDGHDLNNVDLSQTGSTSSFSYTATTGDIKVGSVNTGNQAVSLTATLGSINDASDDTTTDITGTTLTLTARDEIAGNAGDTTDTFQALEVASTSLDVSTTGTGGTQQIVLVESDPTTLTDVDTADGDIFVRSGGALVATDVAANSDVTLIAATGDISVGTISASGLVTIEATLGSINDASDDTTTDITGTTLTLTARDEIAGNASDTTDTLKALEVASTSLDVSTTGTGGTQQIVLVESDGTTLTDVDTAQGSITVVSTTGDLAVGDVDAGTTTLDAVTLKATLGAITDSAADNTVNITAATATLTANTGIGTATADQDIETTVATLVASTTNSGDIVIDETDTLTIGTGGNGVTTAGSLIEITADGTITVDEVVTAGGTGDVLIDAVGTNSDIELNATVTAGDDAHLRAGRDILQPSATVFVVANELLLEAGDEIGAAAAAIDLRVDEVEAEAGQATGLVSDIFLNQDEGGGTLTITDVPDLIAGGTFSSGVIIDPAATSGSISIITEDDPLTVSQAVTARSGGSVTLTTNDVNGGDATEKLFTLTDAAAAAITAPGDGAITITADNMTLGGTLGTIGSGASEVTLQPLQADTTISLGSGADALGVLALTNAELNALDNTTGVTNIGLTDVTGGDVTIAAAVDLSADSARLHLRTAGGVSGAGNIITVDALAITAAKNSAGDVVNVQTNVSPATVAVLVPTRALTANTTTTVDSNKVEIASTAGMAAGERISISDNNSTVELFTILSVDSATKLTLSGNVTDDFTTAEAAFVTVDMDVTISEAAGAGGLTVGTVDGVKGITGTSGEITVSTTDSLLTLKIAQPVGVNNITKNEGVSDDIWLTAGGLDSIIDNNNMIFSGGEPITLEADNMTLEGGTIHSGSAKTTLTVNTPGATISIGDSGGEDADSNLELRDSELETITTTSGIVVGATGAGTITVLDGDPINLDDVNLTLITGGSLTDDGSAGATITLVDTDSSNDDAILTLDSDTGIGGTHGFDGDALGIDVVKLAARTRAETGQGGDIKVSEANTLVIVSAVNSSTAFTADTGVETANDTDGGDDENIDIEVRNGNLRVNQQVTAADKGNVILRADGPGDNDDVILNATVKAGPVGVDGVDANGDVHIRASRDIKQPDPDVFIVADTLLLEAGRNIGEGGDGNGIDTQVTTLGAESAQSGGATRGNIFINEDALGGNLAVDSVNNLIDGGTFTSGVIVNNGAGDTSGAVSISTENGNLTVLRNITAHGDVVNGTGTITLKTGDTDTDDNTAEATFTLDSTNSPTVSTEDGSITIVADQMDIQASTAITAGSPDGIDNVALQTTTANTEIALGVADAVDPGAGSPDQHRLGLTADELNRITTAADSSVVIGNRTHTGGIILRGDVNLSTSENLALITDGSITDDNGSRTLTETGHVTLVAGANGSAASIEDSGDGVLQVNSGPATLSATAAGDVRIQDSSILTTGVPIGPAADAPDALSDAASAGDSVLKIADGEGAKFTVGQTIRITDATSTEFHVIRSINDDGTNPDKITIAGTLANTYAAAGATTIQEVSQPQASQTLDFLAADVSAGPNAVLTIADGEDFKYTVGQTIRITDGTNTETHRIQAIDDDGLNPDRITIDGTLVNSFTVVGGTTILATGVSSTANDGDVELRTIDGDLKVADGAAVAADGAGNVILYAGSDLAPGTNDDVILNDNVTAGDDPLPRPADTNTATQDVHIRASRDILQAAADDFIVADTVLLEAGRRIGDGTVVGAAINPAAIDLRANTVAADSGQAGMANSHIFLNQDAAGPNPLTVGVSTDLIDGGTKSGVFVDKFEPVGGATGAITINTEDATLVVNEDVRSRGFSPGLPPGDGDVILNAGTTDSVPNAGDNDVLLNAWVVADNNTAWNLPRPSGADVHIRASRDILQASLRQDLAVSMASGTNAVTVGSTAGMEAGDFVRISDNNVVTPANSESFLILSIVNPTDLIVDGFLASAVTVGESAPPTSTPTRMDQTLTAETLSGTATVTVGSTAGMTAGNFVLLSDNDSAGESFLIQSIDSATTLTLSGTVLSDFTQAESASVTVTRSASVTVGSLVIADGLALEAGRHIGGGNLNDIPDPFLSMNNPDAIDLGINTGTIAAESARNGSDGNLFLNQHLRGITIGEADNLIDGGGPVSGVGVAVGGVGSVVITTDNGNINVLKDVRARGNATVGMAGLHAGGTGNTIEWFDQFNVGVRTDGGAATLDLPFLSVPTAQITSGFIVDLTVTAGNPNEENLHLTINWGDPVGSGVPPNPLTEVIPLGDVTVTRQHVYDVGWLISQAPPNILISVGIDHNSTIFLTEDGVPVTDVTVNASSTLLPRGPIAVPRAREETEKVVVFAEPPVPEEITNVIPPSVVPPLEFGAATGAPPPDPFRVVLRVVPPDELASYQVYPVSDVTLVGDENIAELKSSLKDNHYQIVIIYSDDSENVTEDFYLRQGREVDESEFQNPGQSGIRIDASDLLQSAVDLHLHHDQLDVALATETVSSTDGEVVSETGAIPSEATDAQNATPEASGSESVEQTEQYSAGLGVVGGSLAVHSLRARWRKCIETAQRAEAGRAVAKTARVRRRIQRFLRG